LSNPDFAAPGTGRRVPTVRRRAGTGRDVQPVRMSVPADRMSRMIDLPEVPFASQSDFAAWLAEHDESSPGVWIKLAKKGSGIASVTYAEALDVALCHGWIDGQTRSIDDTWYLQKFTPRTARSKWSKRNVGKIAELTAAGRMRPRGIAEVERAKADGRWEAAYDSPANATVPDDLQAALDASPAALTMFGTLSSRNRYAILFRISDAKKPETRARRIDKFVQMLADGQTIY
jgi:uncharacterized protein YdeI (YjbR/CyaY-like superfamily)